MGSASCGFLVVHSVREVPGKGLGVFAEEDVAKGRMVWRHAPGACDLQDEASFAALLAGMDRPDAVRLLHHVFGLRDLPGCLVHVRAAGALINHSRSPR